MKRLKVEFQNRPGYVLGRGDLIDLKSEGYRLEREFRDAREIGFPYRGPLSEDAYLLIVDENGRALCVLDGDWTTIRP